MKNLLFFLSFALIFPLQAQNFVMPEYAMKTAEDYSKYAKDVMKAMKWIIDTPLNREYSEQVRINRFVLQWLTGSPQVHLVVRPEVLGNLSAERNFPYAPQMTLVYLSGMGIKALEDADADEGDLQLAGAEALLTAYSHIKHEYKSTHLRRMSKLKEKGKLEMWIDEILPVEEQKAASNSGEQPLQ